MQTLGHHKQWLAALSHSADRHADARLLLAHAANRTRNGKPLVADTRENFIVRTQNLSADGGRYTISIYLQDDGPPGNDNWFLQAVYGHGARAVWFPQ